MKYFVEVQTKDTRYSPLIRPEDTPAIDRNKETMARFRPQMRESIMTHQNMIPTSNNWG